MAWFAVRSVYLWAQRSDGNNVFEERVVVFEAPSRDEAWEKAMREAEAYRTERREVSYVKHPDSVMYDLDLGPYEDGAEVWSEMFQSPQSLEHFYAERYEKYEYSPE